MGRKDRSVLSDDTQKLSVGAMMRLARQGKNIGLTDMSKRVNYTKNYLSNVETGKQSPSYLLIELYERELELEADVLKKALDEETVQTRISSQKNPVVKSGSLVGTGQERLLQEDWGEAPEVRIFYGRQQQSRELKQWIISEKCRVVTILGMGGVGKTSLASRIAEEIKHDFEYVFWRSLQNIPPLSDVLKKCIFLVSDQQETELSANEDEQISLLFGYLQKHRCLLVLDNFESILQEKDHFGRCRAGYEGYGKLIRRLGESSHRSCLLLTSREKPQEITLLEGNASAIRSTQLSGLDQVDGRKLLEYETGGIFGSNDAWKLLIDRYDGNPLALRLISASIRELFGGNIATFLEQGDAVFGDISDLLEQQFLRLSNSEQEIMYWLAIEQETVSMMQLKEDIFPPVSMKDLQENLKSLRQHSMIEVIGTTGFSLLPVIVEYVIDDFIGKVREQINKEELTFLEIYALMRSETREYLRSNQLRRILDPLVTHLLTTLGREGSEKKLRRMLFHLQEMHAGIPGYAAGNILNLLIQLKVDLTGYDFSYLRVQQAYLQGVELHQVNFAYSDVRNSVFTRTIGSAHSIALSPDGQLLAAGMANGEIRLWSINEDKLHSTCVGHTDWVESVTFSPDGRVLASGSDDQTVRIWEVGTGKNLHTLRSHTDNIRSVVFSPDGRVLASGSDDKMICLWQVESGELLNTLYGHDHRVYSIAFSLNGKWLASGSEDRTIKLWNIQTGQCEKTFKGHAGGVYSVAFSPHNSLLFSGSGDHTIRVWKIDETQLLKTLSQHTSWVQAVAVSPDGKVLVSCSEDRTVRLWEVETGRCLKILREHHSNIYSVAFSKDGKFFVSGGDDQTVRLWRTATGECLKTLQGYSNRVYSVIFSPDGRLLASGGDDQQIRIWEVSTGRCLKTMQGYSSWRYALAFSPDSQLLASGSDDQKIYIWHVRTGESFKTLQGHDNWVRSVTFSPDGEWLASGLDNYAIRLWHIKTGESYDLEGHTNWIRAVTFSLDGKWLASASNDQTVRLWSMESRSCSNVLGGHENIVYSLAFSPQGEFLASGCGDHKVRLWHMDTLEQVRYLQGHTNQVWSVAFSPNGELLVSGSDDQTIRVWQVSSGECIRSWKGHKSSLQVVTFSPHDDIVASGDYEGTIKFWDVKSGACLRTLSNPKPYEGLNITGVRVLEDFQKTMLKELGAIDDEE